MFADHWREGTSTESHVRTLLSNYQLSALRFIAREHPEWRTIATLYQNTTLSLIGRGLVAVRGKHLAASREGKRIISDFIFAVPRRKNVARLSSVMAREFGVTKARARGASA
jgi:hypothetical protein